MGLFDSKSSIIGAALGVSGAFDKSRKTDKVLFRTLNDAPFFTLNCVVSV